jgi:hypothetical protein
MATRNGQHVGPSGPAYLVWYQMHYRAAGHRAHHKRAYVDRGIKVCERWASFDNFYADMGNPPDGLTLDREDNDGDYSPENCRWVTRKEQMRNQTRTRWVEFGGERMALSAWAERVGLHREVLRGRLERGWPIERALTEPSRGAA